MLPCHFSDVELLLISPIVKNIPLIFIINGIFFGMVCDYLNIKFLLKWKSVKLMKINAYLFEKYGSCFYSAFYFNIVYNYLFELFFKVSYENVVKNTEKGFLEQFGPYGIYKFSLLWRWFIMQYAPYIIFLSLGIIFISLNFFIVFLFLHVKFFLFFLNNFGLLFIGLTLFFIECKQFN